MPRGGTCTYDANSRRIASGLSHLGIKLQFSINATADSPVVTTSGKKIHEEAKAKRKAKKEYRKIKQEAMRRLADMEREEAIQKELDRLLSKKNKDITNS
jgi:hypothetical protein